GRLCYRLSITDKVTSEQLYLWLSAQEGVAKLKLQLVKTGVGLDDDEPIESTVYGDVIAIREASLPQNYVLVRGLKEDRSLKIINGEIGVASETPAFQFPPK